MNSLKRFGVFGITALLMVLAGCTGPRYPLSEQARRHLGSTNVMLGVEQQEINADIAGSKVAEAMGGGLIPALIDASIEKGQAKKADKYVGPIRNVLLDYDFPPILGKAILSSLRKVDWLHLNKAGLVRESGNEWMLKSFNNSEADTVLYIIASYRFSCKFKDINVSCETFMLPKTETLYDFRQRPKKDDPVARGNSIYRNKELKITRPLGVDNVDLDKAVELWAENGGKRVRDALNEAAIQLADAIAEDLCNTEKK